MFSENGIAVQPSLWRGMILIGCWPEVGQSAASCRVRTLSEFHETETRGPRFAPALQQHEPTAVIGVRKEWHQWPKC